jgi:hypothetical protein
MAHWAVPSAEVVHQSEALLCALDYLLHSGFRSSHDRVEQAVTSDGGIESRANRFAIPDASQSGQ